MPKKQEQTVEMDPREQFRCGMFALSVGVGTHHVGAIVAAAARMMRERPVGEVASWAREIAPRGHKETVSKEVVRVAMLRQNRALARESRARPLAERLATFRVEQAERMFRAAGFRESESAWVPDAAGMQVVVAFDSPGPATVTPVRRTVWSPNGKWSATAVSYRLSLPSYWARTVAPHAHDFGPGTFVLDIRDGEYLVARKGVGFNVSVAWKKKRSSRRSDRGAGCQGEPHGHV